MNFENWLIKCAITIDDIDVIDDITAHVTKQTEELYTLSYLLNKIFVFLLKFN